jgi:hypothetical protein
MPGLFQLAQFVQSDSNNIVYDAGDEERYAHAYFVGDAHFGFYFSSRQAMSNRNNTNDTSVGEVA